MVEYVIYDGKQANVHGLTNQNLVVKRSQTLQNEFTHHSACAHTHTHSRARTQMLTRNLDYYVLERKMRNDGGRPLLCLCACVCVKNMRMMEKGVAE